MKFWNFWYVTYVTVTFLDTLLDHFQVIILVRVPLLACIILGIMLLHLHLHHSYDWTSAEHIVSRTFWDLMLSCFPIWKRNRFGVTQMNEQSNQRIIFITVKTMKTHLSRTLRGLYYQYIPVGSTVKKLQRFCRVCR